VIPVEVVQVHKKQFDRKCLLDSVFFFLLPLCWNITIKYKVYPLGSSIQLGWDRRKMHTVQYRSQLIRLKVSKKMSAGFRDRDQMASFSLNDVFSNLGAQNKQLFQLAVTSQEQCNFFS